MDPGNKDWTKKTMAPVIKIKVTVLKEYKLIYLLSESNLLAN